MNLLDSHDTERILWTLTPGPETTAGRERDAANVAEGKLRVAPRLAHPVHDAGRADRLLRRRGRRHRRRRPRRPAHLPVGGPRRHARHRALAALLGAGRAPPRARRAPRWRSRLPARRRRRRHRRLRPLDRQPAALVALNRDDTAQALDDPRRRLAAERHVLTRRYGVGTRHRRHGHRRRRGRQLTLPRCPALLLATGTLDLAGPPAARPGCVSTGEANTEDRSRGTPSRRGRLRRVPQPGVGRRLRQAERRRRSPARRSATTGLGNARRAFSSSARWTPPATRCRVERGRGAAAPRHRLGQPPVAADHDAHDQSPRPDRRTSTARSGSTASPTPRARRPACAPSSASGPTAATRPATPTWTWVEAAFNTNAGNNDEFVASLLPETTGTFDYAYRYTDDRRSRLGLRGPRRDRQRLRPAQAGRLTVVASGDTTAPATPTGLHVVSASPAGIELAWDAVASDPTLYGYEVRRADEPAGRTRRSRPPPSRRSPTPPSRKGDVPLRRARGGHVVQPLGPTRRGDRDGRAADRDAAVPGDGPGGTDGSGRTVYIAGFLDRLDGGLPQWDPAGVELTRVDATHWTITLTGTETTQIEYKYALGSWDYVEKDAACGEIANRQLTLSYGATGRRP